jgi:hypothetical protein
METREAKSLGRAKGGWFVFDAGVFRELILRQALDDGF